MILLNKEFKSKEGADEVFADLAFRCTRFPAVGGCGRPRKPKGCALIWLLLVVDELLPLEDKKRSVEDMLVSGGFVVTGEKGEGAAKIKNICEF